MTGVNKLIELIDHNRWTVLAMALIAMMTVYVSACAPTVTSPFSGEQVTREQLNAEIVHEATELRESQQRIRKRRTELVREVAVFNLQMEGKASDLEQEAAEVLGELETIDLRADPAFAQLEAKETAINDAINHLIAMGGPAVSQFLPVLGAAGVIFGVGTIADNRRKDRVIVNRDAKIGQLAGSAAVS